MQPGMCPSSSWSSTSLWRMPCMSLQSSSCGRSWSAPTPRATGSDCPPGFLSVSLCSCSSSSIWHQLHLISLASSALLPSCLICVAHLYAALSTRAVLLCLSNLHYALLALLLCTSLRAALTSACCVCSVVHLVHSLAHPILQVSTLSAVPPLAASHFDHALVQCLVMHLWWKYCLHVVWRRESSSFGLVHSWLQGMPEL